MDVCVTHTDERRVQQYPLWSIFSIVEIIYLIANISLLVWNIPKGWHCE